MLGERRMLHPAASLADHAPVSLGEAITGIDDHNVDLLLTAIGHAAGRSRVPSLTRTRARAALYATVDYARSPVSPPIYLGPY